MSLDTLAYRTARSHVYNYAGESEELMIRHREAMECRDCEAFLQLGIDAFDWLGRADTDVRMAVFEGRVQFNPEIDEALACLYKMWLKPCDFAEKWISVQIDRGYRPDNLDEFRRCCDEVRAIVRGNDEVDGEIARFRDRAIEAQRRGETVEWEEEPANS